MTLCDIIELEDDAPKRQKPDENDDDDFRFMPKTKAERLQLPDPTDSCSIPIQLRLLFRPGVRRVFLGAAAGAAVEAAASAHLRHGDDSHR